jgi:hypothetical protein
MVEKRLPNFPIGSGFYVRHSYPRSLSRWVQLKLFGRVSTSYRAGTARARRFLRQLRHLSQRIQERTATGATPGWSLPQTGITQRYTGNRRARARHDPVRPAEYAVIQRHTRRAAGE